MMGAGKSTVGRALAKHLSWDFVDTDTLVEQQTGVRVPVIFDLEGEAGFRKRESHALSCLLGRTRLVVATGGGIVLAPENRALLARLGSVVYLRASAQELYQRTRFDKNRPLLQSPNPCLVIEALLSQRVSLYESCANLVVDTGRQPLLQLIHDMCQQLQLNLRNKAEPSKAGGSRSAASVRRKPGRPKKTTPVSSVKS
jgi:shikimate kinase